MPLLTLLATLLFLPSVFAADVCTWCIADDSASVHEVDKLLALTPKALLKAVRGKGVLVNIFDSGRKHPRDGSFTWSMVEVGDKTLSDYSNQQALTGRSYCAGEHADAKGKPLIVLANDAPLSTLIHEYLHTRQMAKDASWCAAGAKGAGEEALSDREWDVHRALWKMRGHKKFNLEDRISIGSNLLEQARAREERDSSAMAFIAQEKVLENLMALIDQYKTAHGMNKKTRGAIGVKRGAAGGSFTP
jgi:hypothetical protein